MQQKLDYAENEQTKYFTGENFPNYGIYCMHVWKYVCICMYVHKWIALIPFVLHAQDGNMDTDFHVVLKEEVIGPLLIDCLKNRYSIYFTDTHMHTEREREREREREQETESQHGHCADDRRWSKEQPSGRSPFGLMVCLATHPTPP